MLPENLYWKEEQEQEQRNKQTNKLATEQITLITENKN
jgi:hypothetical protein